MTRFLRIGVSIDPLIEKLVPCTEFTVDEEHDAVTVFYKDELFGYFAGVEYAYIDLELEIDEDIDLDALDDEDDDDFGDGGPGGPGDDPGPVLPVTNTDGGTFAGQSVETVDIPVLLSSPNGSSPDVVDPELADLAR